MSRLTRFNNLTKEYEYHLNNPNTSMVQDEIAGIQKLGQLEDIEEELGIDLITFSKVLYALDNECVFVKEMELEKHNTYSIFRETGKVERRIIARFSRFSNGSRDWFFTTFFTFEPDEYLYYLEDYGKTWALTKEELL